MSSLSSCLHHPHPFNLCPTTQTNLSPHISVTTPDTSTKLSLATSLETCTTTVISIMTTLRTTPIVMIGALRLNITWTPEKKFESSGFKCKKRVMLQLLLTLNHDNISFTYCSDLIALDSSYMTYLLHSQSAQLWTFPSQTIFSQLLILTHYL